MSILSKRTQAPPAVPSRAELARQAVQAAVELHARWEAQFGALSAEVHSLRDRAPSEVIDRPDAVPEIAASIARVEAEQTVAASTAAEAQRRIDAAQRAVWVAEADDADEAADAERRQGEDLQRQIDALLAPLEAVAGVPFGPKAITAQIGGLSLTPRTSAEQHFGREKALRSKATDLRQRAERAGPEAVAVAVAALAEVS